MSRWLVAVVTAGLVLSGSFKDLEVLDVLPADATLLLAAVVAVLVALRLVSDPVPRAAHTVIVGFLLLVPAAFLTAPTEYGADKELRLFTLTFLSMFAPVVLIRDRSDVRRHVLALAGVAALVAAVALVDPQPSSDYEGAPVATESAGTIGLGIAAAVVVVIATMGVIWRTAPWQVALPAAAASVYVLLQSGSRGPLLATVLAVLAGAFLVRVRPALGRAVAVASLVGVGLLAAFRMAPLYARDRIIDLLTGETAGSVDNRVRLIDDALDVVDRNPWGVGWGGFEAETFAAYRYPHNLPLEVLAEAGLLFGTLFLGWLVLCFVRAHRATVDPTGGTVFALLVFAFAEAMVSGDLNDNRLAFYVLGIAVAAASLPGADGPPDQLRRGLVLREYADVALARWRLLTASLLIGLLAAAAVTLSTPPRYEADATIYISMRAASGAVSEGRDPAAEHLPTYTAVITSERVATEVARALGAGLSPSDVAARISVTRPPETVLLRVTVLDPAPEQAARIANLVVGLAVDAVAEMERPAGSTAPPLVSAQLVEAASVPTEAVRPRTWVDLVLGGLLGLLGGMAAAFLRHGTATTATTRELVRAVTRRPVLGAIDTDAAAEAFRRLRTVLRHTDIPGPRPVWLVTSPRPRDGTTTVVGGLAAAMADAGTRVLVVDGNTCRPRVAELLGAGSGAGLGDVLARGTPLDQAVHHVRTGLDVLAHGPLPVDPAAVLDAAAIPGLLDQARKDYDVVLVDTAPLEHLADLAPLMRVADGVLLVLPVRAVDRARLEAAREVLDGAGVALVGTVLTGTVPDRRGHDGPDAAHLAAWSARAGALTGR
jgi:capsular exopolysaccharide synthesis family protein